MEVRGEQGGATEPGGGGAPEPQADGIIGKEGHFLQNRAQTRGHGSCPNEPILSSFLEGLQNKEELTGNTNGWVDGWVHAINMA